MYYPRKVEQEGNPLSGKRVAKVKIKSDGDVFHELWKSLQLQIPSMTPTTFQSCQTLGGQVGIVGCVILWNYFLDGKDCFAKTQIVDIDSEKKSITYKLLDGDLANQYETLVVNIRVEADGLENLVTWTAEYEKLSPDVPDPDTLMDFYIKATKEIETRLLQN
ncbi:unnamed protein product [Lactuca virosa]|uniref:Bet v I/Major latex protein domain-containing protein n=1 Tax=Lactuca virosa TaxID=75947 RepID=A0AAU9LDP8_9ASTR|nr:unnamed protein product [Lactuca virosa]